MFWKILQNFSRISSQILKNFSQNFSNLSQFPLKFTPNFLEIILFQNSHKILTNFPNLYTNN